MVLFPNAKINIGLYITEKRADGFHNIETIFVPIPKLCDILEILPFPQQAEPVKFTQSGLHVDGESSNNLCVKAYHLLNSKTPLPAVAMHLHKQIPMGAGLGGGSADGAFALSMLNNLAQEPLTPEELAQLALELGSDCPFFFENSPNFGYGRGEQLDAINLNLQGYYILLVNPGIHINTGLAYKQSRPTAPSFNLKEISNYCVEDWKNLISNDFEKVVFPLHPKIMELKKQLYDMGAVYSSMSGSGSTVFGIFKMKPIIEGRFRNFYTFISEL
jgi:4-diphosphocytidyl-2-C-methyl-D-erythritol kinase